MFAFQISRGTKLVIYKYHHSTKLAYTRKYHEFVAVCIVTSAQRQQTSDIFPGIAWYYSDNDFIIRNFDFIARSDAHT